MMGSDGPRFRCGDVIVWVGAERRLARSYDRDTVTAGDLGTYITGDPPDDLVVTFPGATFTCRPSDIEPVGRS